MKRFLRASRRGERPRDRGPAAARTQTCSSTLSPSANGIGPSIRGRGGRQGSVPSSKLHRPGSASPRGLPRSKRRNDVRVREQARQARARALKRAIKFSASVGVPGRKSLSANGLAQLGVVWALKMVAEPALADQRLQFVPARRKVLPTLGQGRASRPSASADVDGAGPRSRLLLHPLSRENHRCRNLPLAGCRCSDPRRGAGASVRSLKTWALPLTEHRRWRRPSPFVELPDARGESPARWPRPPTIWFIPEAKRSFVDHRDVARVAHRHHQVPIDQAHGAPTFQRSAWLEGQAPAVAFRRSGGEPASLR